MILVGGVVRGDIAGWYVIRVASPPTAVMEERRWVREAATSITRRTPLLVPYDRQLLLLM